ncbi:MAG: hypothetical protein K9N39_11035, partial [Candidatus Cloacimonetes bacterium]|nr:hypothetical protein [Candidatus Cloacimonadota bacterium]MCF7814925.1 hypothetical protein [Candidatus Cloacimonadota bacterium]
MLFSVSSWLHSTTWHIKLDGTGNFTTIQAGINASTHSDTVLVYPGTYFENLDFNGKNIMLSSLELTTGNSQYINSTIIDGQRQESCIRIHNGETDAIVRGFTIQNGYGTQFWGSNGGGVLVHDYSTAFVINCLLINNLANGGAALYARHGFLNLSGLTIKNNSAHLGGAIYINDESTINFDPVNRCSIYNNNAGKGADIYIEDSGQIDVIVDTFSVFNPSRFFTEYYGDSSYSFDIHNNWMELVPHNLYVAQNGNDNNSGLSSDEPLKNISWAVRKIQADEFNPRTVYVDGGLYSHAFNQQIFPIGCKEFVSVIGEDMNFTFICDDFLGGPIVGRFLNGTIELSNFTILNEFYLDTFSIISFYYVDKVILKNIKIHNNNNTSSIFENEFVYNEYENLIITDNVVQGFNAGLRLNNNAGYMKNCIITNNESTMLDGCSEVALQLMAYDDFTIENCIFSGNHSADPEGRIIRTTRHNGSGPPTTPTIRFNNCLIANNSIGSNYVCQNFNYDGLTEFNNCTIVNNTASGGFYSSALYNYGDVNITNTIMRNNTDYEVMMVDDTQYGYVYELNIDHSNIRNGEDGIYNMNNANVINWNDGNINEDPLFLQSGDDPYQLTEFSSCIDSGTPDTTGLFLPPWDLLHHGRIWDGDNNGEAIIDMGCYEFGADSVGVTNHQLPMTSSQMTNYPNPFNPSTTISFNLFESGKVKVEIFNIKGQMVKKLMDCTTAPGNYKCVWNGKNDAGKSVSSGEYFARLKVNGEEIDVRKM